MITAVIIDDEAPARDALSNMLKLYCPSVQLIGEAHSMQSGIKLIESISPDAVFLDIQMPDGSGFDLLKHFKTLNFKFVFITAFQEFAVRAFRFSAIDFILKPIDPTDLANAVDKLQETIREDETNQKFKAFIENIQSKSRIPNKIILKTLDEVIIVETSSIVRCESNNNYTMFYFNDKSKILVSKTLKEYDDLLSSIGFFRTHQSHLVNLRFIKSYSRFPDSQVTLIDGTTIPVSVRKRDLLTSLLKKQQKNGFLP